jgi:hypothetical protein
MVISFKDTSLEAVLDKRSDKNESPSLVAKRDLARYYWLLDHEQNNYSLTNAQFGLICDALNGTWFSEPWSINH